MKFTKLCLMFTAATLAVGAFADAANALISFSTEADFYHDGSPVANGESMHFAGLLARHLVALRLTLSRWSMAIRF